MDYMDPDVLCPQKRPINLISLSLAKVDIGLACEIIIWSCHNFAHVSCGDMQVGHLIQSLKTFNKEIFCEVLIMKSKILCEMGSCITIIFYRI